MLLGGAPSSWKTERRERTRVLESAALVPQRLALGGVLRRRVLGRAPCRAPCRTSTRANGRAGFTGNGCVGEYHSSGHVALRHGTLLDAEDRLAGGAIEDEHVAGLADRRERGHAPAVLHDVDEHRRRRHVEVPQVVVHGLEVPAVLAGLGVDGDDRVAEQIVAGPVAAPVVRRPAPTPACRGCRAPRRASCRTPRRWCPSGRASRSRATSRGPSRPGSGTLWNCHSFLPVRTSNARVSPGGPSGTSPG